MVLVLLGEVAETGIHVVEPSRLRILGGCGVDRTSGVHKVFDICPRLIVLFLVERGHGVVVTILCSCLSGVRTLVVNTELEAVAVPDIAAASLVVVAVVVVDLCCNVVVVIIPTEPDSVIKLSVIAGFLFLIPHGGVCCAYCGCILTCSFRALYLNGIIAPLFSRDYTVKGRLICAESKSIEVLVRLRC